MGGYRNRVYLFHEIQADNHDCISRQENSRNLVPRIFQTMHVIYV